jgi:acetyltransferase-like isoleucine patch superfamily enzyme
MIIQFIKKYTFPVHIMVSYSILSSFLSQLLSTLSFKIKMKMLKNEYGKNVTIIGKTVISSKTQQCISIGSNFTLVSRFKSNLVGITNNSVLQCLKGGKISIADNCGISSVIISSHSKISIGNNVLIGANVRLYDHDYHSLNHLHRRSASTDIPKSIPIYIEDDVFIGTNSIILKGVRIGARSIIGAGSVVSLKSIPEDSIVIGNPASIVRSNKP